MVAAAAFRQASSLVREVLDRALSLPELAVSLAHRGSAKKIRVRVVVLRDENGRPVVDEEAVERPLAEARSVFASEASVEIVPVDERMVETRPDPAPTAALDAPCTDSGLWRADLGPVGEYLRPLALGRLGVVGRGTPVTVFVVRDVVGKCGCSLGPLGDYVTIDPRGLETPRILAHELGHSCGLAHRKDEGNLMRGRGPGERLSRWQRAVLRSSRHVTYL